jgi:hypothetical protein
MSPSVKVRHYKTRKWNQVLWHIRHRWVGVSFYSTFNTKTQISVMWVIGLVSFPRQTCKLCWCLSHITASYMYIAGGPHIYPSHRKIHVNCTISIYSLTLSHTVGLILIECRYHLCVYVLHKTDIHQI